MIEKQTIILQDDDILIRPLLVADITDEYIDGLNDPDVNRYLVGVRQQHQTRESVTNYVRANEDSPLSILFGIFINVEDDPFIGTIRVHNIDYFHFFAAIGVCLFAKRAWKKGYAHNALRMVKEYLFKEYQIHYLEAGAYKENVESIKCFLTAGFVEIYQVSNKYRHIDSFKEVTYLAAVNPLFDSNLLKKSTK